MDIVDFWSKQITIWDENNKCGLCWSFGAPLVSSQLNIEQSIPGKECCVNVFLTDITFREAFTLANTGFKRTSSCA